MKKILFLLFFASAAILTSCKKETKSDPQPVDPPEPVFQFTQGDVFYSDVSGNLYWLNDPEGVAVIKKIYTDPNPNKKVTCILTDIKKGEIYEYLKILNFFFLKIFFSL